MTLKYKRMFLSPGNGLIENEEMSVPRFLQGIFRGQMVGYSSNDFREWLKYKAGQEFQQTACSASFS
jgi:hypothetical protein